MNKSDHIPYYSKKVSYFDALKSLQ